jgi:hypothetical protein
MTMEPVTVKSSVLAQVQFLERSNILKVVFHTGRVYRYFMVPRRVYEELIEADSIGRYFNLEVKDCFSSERLA